MIRWQETHDREEPAEKSPGTQEWARNLAIVVITCLMLGGLGCAVAAVVWLLRVAVAS